MRSTGRWVGYSMVLIVATGSQPSGTGRKLLESPNEPAPVGTEVQPPSTTLTPALRTGILAAMRLNRQAFQEDAVLSRYNESRPASTSASASCDLPRTASGAPRHRTFRAAGARRAPSRNQGCRSPEHDEDLSGNRARRWHSTTTEPAGLRLISAGAASRSSCVSQRLEDASAGRWVSR